MVENLVDLFTELSQELVRHELQMKDDDFKNKRKLGAFNKYVRILRRKCFDFLLRKDSKLDFKDPCKTPYGADWNPVILLLDHGGELARSGAEIASKKLYSNILILQGKDYKCLGDVYKLILILQGSDTRQQESQPDFFNTLSEYSLNTNRDNAQDEWVSSSEINLIQSESLCNKYSATVFESCCLILNKLSNKNITERISSRQSGSACSSRVAIQSRSRSPSVFQLRKNSCSNNSFVQIAKSLYVSNHSILDNFVEKPISYKLRSAEPSLESSTVSPADESGGSGEHFTNVNNLNVQSLENVSNWNDYWTEIYEVEETTDLENVKVELNHSSNSTDLYPISKENSLKLTNCDSCFSKKFMQKRKNLENNVKNSFFESPATLILALWEQENTFKYNYEEEFIHCLTELRVVELDQYLKDVQFLLVGVESDTFITDEKKKSFTMKEGTCLEGITPNTLLSFSQEYMDIGACYLKLNHLARLNLKKQMNFRSKDCRIIDKIFWMSIYEYLCRHSQWVFKIPVTLGLLEFKAYTKYFYPVITAVADACKVTEPEGSLPKGGELLSYLFQITPKISNKTAAGIFFGFLKSCCETYLLHVLQDWMFQGALDRHHCDFFIEHRPRNLRCRDRSYYHSFFKFSDRTPSFLKGVEDKIFNCGKTIHLLKLIQPESKLCRILETRAYPKMKLCLSEEELKEQEKAFEDYAKKILNVCGKFASIALLKQEEIERESYHEKYVMKVKREQEIEREALKKDLIEERRLKREEQNQWLKKQMELAAEEKKRKKEEEEKESKLFLKKIQMIAEEEKKIVEEEKINLRLYYKELMEEIEKKKTEAVSPKQRSRHLNQYKLLRNYKSSEEVTEVRQIQSNAFGDGVTLIDDNVTIDSEGNIVGSNETKSCQTIFPKSKYDSDFSNSNVSGISLDSQIEDIQNENLNVNEADVQLQNLIASRIEYFNRLESDAVSLDNEIANQILVSPSLDNNSNENECIDEVPVLHAEKDPEDLEMENEESGGENLGSCENKLPPAKMEAIKNKMKLLSSELYLGFDSHQETPAQIPAKASLSEAEKNKKKFLATEFDITSDGEKVSPDKVPRATTESMKNKMKLMETEYYTTVKENAEAEDKTTKPLAAETEAQKNKKKVMSAEFDVRGDNAEEEIKVSKGLLGPEALKNKRKLMETEYGSISNTDNLKRTVSLIETEAEKNRKKIMGSELIEGSTVGITETEVKAPIVETDAQKNKKKVMSSEFGEGISPPKERCKRVLSEEAQRNKEKYLEAEYGYSKKSESGKTSENIDSGTKECKKSAKELEFFSKLEAEDSECFIGSGRCSSFAEKALKIYNKERAMCGDPNFFTMENISNEGLQNGFPWLNCKEVQILYEQIRKPVPSTDSKQFETVLSDMDITTFMNCLRRSVLIPLKIQEEIANEALFNHLLKEESMLSHFNALRNYFFLNDGEFSRRLTQNIFLTLGKCTEPQQFFKRSTFNEIVYEALNYTIHSNEPNVQNVSFEINKMPEFLSHFSHDVLSPFELSYQVKWPLNIILTESAIKKYREIFHYLLKLKRINWTLNENFLYLNYSCKEKHIESRLLVNSTHYHKIHIYRHAMAQFMRTLENYTSSCTLQFSWMNFQKDLESAKNLDHLYDKHVRYVKEVLKLCFLTKENRDLMNCINSLIELSLKFHSCTKIGNWVLNGHEYEHTKYDVLRATFDEFCGVTADFMATLRKKVSSHRDFKPHVVLVEKFDFLFQ